MAQGPQSLDQQTFYRTFIAHDVRRDGRKFNEYRATTVNMKNLSSADGSAIFCMGTTTVICGIKAVLAPPKPDSPKEGFLIANIEMSPLCSPEFTPGPPSDRAQYSSVLLRRALVESECLDLQQLCIYSGKLVWAIYIDVICLNDDGSLFATAVAAAVAALRTVQLPKIEYDENTGSKRVFSEERWPLQISATPFATQFAIFNDKQILYDPTCEEELHASGLATVIAGGHLEKDIVLNITGSIPISETDMAECISAAKKRSKVLYQLVQEAEKSPGSKVSLKKNIYGFSTNFIALLIYRIIGYIGLKYTI